MNELTQNIQKMMVPKAAIIAYKYEDSRNSDTRYFIELRPIGKSGQMGNISVMGLVAFPGTMIGQILGGSSPNVAIKYQMMIMVITFTASMLSLMITISLASRKSFDAYGKLRPVMVEKKGKSKP